MKIALSSLINPSEKQKQFLKALGQYKYLLYGGAKGGGKSYILRWALVKLLLQWKARGHKHVRVGIFCEDYPSLKDRQISKIAEEFPPWLGKLGDNQVHGMSFMLRPELGGGIIALRNLDDPSKYASSEFAAVAVDELTKNEKNVFDQFRSIVRWKGIDETKFLAGTNPGGIGHEWVKRLWISREFEENEPEASKFFFLQALARDNKYLSPQYVKQLEGLPEKLRKAYLEGDWNIFEGQYFSEWRNDVHSCEPFAVPESWKRMRVIDHGRTAPTACLWGAIDHDGNVWWYREHYKAGQDADINAQEIARVSAGESYAFTLLDSSCFSKTGTEETIAEIYQRNGVHCQPSHKNRIAGWTLLHEYLRQDVEGRPRMRFFKNCMNAVRTIPTLWHDEDHPEDLDTDGEDHAVDCVSYALQWLHESKSPVPLDPLQKKFEDFKKKHTFSPQNLNKYYGNR